MLMFWAIVYVPQKNTKPNQLGVLGQRAATINPSWQHQASFWMAGAAYLSRSSSSDKGQGINPHYPHLPRGGNFAEQVVQRIQSAVGRGLVSPAPLVTGWVAGPSDVSRSMQGTSAYLQHKSIIRNKPEARGLAGKTPGNEPSSVSLRKPSDILFLIILGLVTSLFTCLTRSTCYSINTLLVR